MKTPKVELFDTSLRDGLQQPNLEISVPSAVDLLQRMGSFGVQFAEIGFAGANQFTEDLCVALEPVTTGSLMLALSGALAGVIQTWRSGRIWRSCCDTRNGSRYR